MILPSQFIFEVIELESEEFNVGRSISRGGVMQINGVPGSRCRFTIKTPPLRVSEMKDLAGFIDDVGYSNPFTVQFPIFSEGRGTRAGTPVVAADVDAGSKVITISGLTANQSSVLKSMDPLTFANHTKAYFVAPKYSGPSIVENGYASDGAGNASIRVTKPVSKAIPAGTAIDMTSPSVTVVADEMSWKAEIDANRGNFASLELPVIEYT